MLVFDRTSITQPVLVENPMPPPTRSHSNQFRALPIAQWLAAIQEVALQNPKLDDALR